MQCSSLQNPVTVFLEIERKNDSTFHMEAEKTPNSQVINHKQKEKY